MRDGGEWLEARANAPGLLDGLPIEWGDPADDATRFDGIFSLVVDGSGGRTRRLPSLYHANAQLFAHRDVDAVRARLVRTVDTVLAAGEQPSYLVTACRVGERHGLYARDIFNRDPFRLRAARAGLVLADDSYVHLKPDGRFETIGWAPFHPEFVVVNEVRAPDGVTNRNRGAFLAFLFGILRVGDMGVVELHHLVRTIKTAEVVTTDDPEELVATLSAR